MRKKNTEKYKRCDKKRINHCQLRLGLTGLKGGSRGGQKSLLTSHQIPLMLITICCRHSWHIRSLKLHLPPGKSRAHTSHCSVMIALNVKNTHLWVPEGFWPAAVTTGEHSSKYQTPEKETRFVLFICTERLMQLWRHSVKNRNEKNFSCRKDSNTTDQQETVLPNKATFEDSVT